MKNTATTTTPVKTATPEFIEAVTNRLSAMGKPRIPAQTLFAIVSECAGYDVNARNVVGIYTMVKPLVEALVLSETIKFRFVENGTSFYTVPTIPSDGTGVKPAGKGELRTSWRLPKSSVHYTAGVALATRVFKANTEALAEAEKQLTQGLVFHKGEWKSKQDYKPVEDDDKKYDDLLAVQMRQVSSIRALTQQYPTGWSFDVKCDDRGRFNYLGGYASPHCGRLARMLYTLDDMVTLDHRTSFAQNFSLLTGSKLGKMCGVGTDADVDFWTSALAHYGLTIKPHSPEREISKRYGMPRFYGAGETTATEKATSVAGEYIAKGKLSEQRFKELLKALQCLGEDLRDFCERARAFAQGWVDIGEHPRWTTPSGYTSCQKYYTHVDKAWNSGTNEVWAYPKNMTSRLATRRICEKSDKEKGDKSVLVATTANILQSLDASVLALAIVEFKSLTGYAPYTIHDSYTVMKEDHVTLMTCVVNAMRKVADSDEVKALRRELALPPVKVLFGNRKEDPKVRNLDMRAMNPLDIE